LFLSAAEVITEDMVDELSEKEQKFIMVCELGDWRKALGPWFSGDAQYAVEL